MARVATSPRLLESMREELAELRHQLTHYNRLTSTLNLQLEELDRAQMQAFRHAQELVRSIAAEEQRLAAWEPVTPLRRGDLRGGDPECALHETRAAAASA